MKKCKNATEGCAKIYNFLETIYNWTFITVFAHFYQ